MRITYIHQHFKTPAEPGGARPWEFARRLADHGHEVTVIAGGETTAEYRIEGLHVIRCRAPYTNRMSVSRRMVAFVEFVGRASWKALRQPADVIFASSTPLTTAVPGILASKITGARFVFEVRDLWPEVPVNLGIVKSRPLIAAARLLERIAYRSADEIIALSPGMARGVLAVDPKACVSVIPNAADFDSYTPLLPLRVDIRSRFRWGDELVLVYAGSFGPIYGLEFLVRLAAELKPKGVRTVIIGDGQTMLSLRRQATSLGLDPDDLLPGPKGKKEVAFYLVAADATASCLMDTTVLNDSSLNKAFDSMAAGRPMFFNHGGWLSDLMQSAGAGWHLPVDDPVAAGEIVSKCMHDRELLEAAGCAAKELGRKQFDRDQLFMQFHELLTRDRTITDRSRSK